MESKKRKKGSEEPRGRTGKKTQTDLENGLEDKGRGKGKLGRSERVAWTYIHYQNASPYKFPFKRSLRFVTT